MKIINKYRTIISQTLKDFKYNHWHYEQRANITPEIKFAELRKKCHMLDKGLNNVNFEKGHSLSIYKEAVILRDELKETYKNDRCFDWVNEIIGRFENAQITGKVLLENQNFEDYSDIQISEYVRFIESRTSCRNFIQKEIPHDIIRKMSEVAIMAPNGCCQQSVRFFFTQDQEKIKTAVPNIAGITNFTNIQCLVCVASECSCYNLNDKYLQYVDASLAAGNLLLGARLYGVYGTMCNFFHANESQILKCKDIFGLSNTQNIVVFIAMGYPIAIPEKPTRRNIDIFYKEV